MTIPQIVALIIAGPVGFILLFRIYAVARGVGTFTLLEAFILFMCLAIILVAFLGINT